MRQLFGLLVFCGLAMAQAAVPSHPVAIRLEHDGNVCFVASVQPMTVEADPGDKIEWTASDTSSKCADRAVRLVNFKLQSTGNAKDPVPGCHKEITSGGPAIRCTVNGANKGESFKYDVDLPGGRGMDPEIRIRN